MNIYLTVSILVTFGYVQQVPAMSLVEPISFALIRTLNDDQIPTEAMCPDNYKEIEKLKVQAGRLRNDLIPVLSDKLPNSNSVEGIEDLITQYCIPNEDIIKTAKSVSTNVKNCLNGKTNLNIEKIEEIQNLTINNICGGISSLITWNIMMNKNMQQ